MHSLNLKEENALDSDDSSTTPIDLGSKRRVRHNSYRNQQRRQSKQDLGLFPGIVTSTKNKTCYTNGRPPWYSLQSGDGDKDNCYVIGITGELT